MPNKNIDRTSDSSKWENVPETQPVTDAQTDAVPESETVTTPVYDQVTALLNQALALTDGIELATAKNAARSIKTALGAAEKWANQVNVKSKPAGDDAARLMLDLMVAQLAAAEALWRGVSSVQKNALRAVWAELKKGLDTECPAVAEIDRIMGIAAA